MPQGPEIFVLVLIVALIGVPIWAMVDAARLPAPAFRAAGHNKTLWVLLPLSVFIIAPLGLIAAIIWFAGIAPSVKRAAHRNVQAQRGDAQTPPPPPPPPE